MMNSRPTRKPEGRGPFRKLRRIIARVVAGKPFLITVSALAAVVCWSALVASDGTLTRQKTFANVAVTVTGEAALKSRGYIVMDDILEKVPAVKMTVEVTQANYNRVSGTAYNPHFDLSQITGEGENELSVTYYSSQLYGPVVSCEPASITVNVERYITRRVPVVLEMTGTIPEGLYLDSYKTDPTTLSVSGPQSLVASVARVVARLDQSALSERRMTDRSALNIELQDSQGNVVVSDKLEITNQSVITNSVVVETELVPMKNVPLEAQSFVTGEPAEGYELTAIELAEETVPVAARQELLDAIDALTTDSPLNIGGATEDVTGYVRLKKLTAYEIASSDWSSDVCSSDLRDRRDRPHQRKADRMYAAPPADSDGRAGGSPDRLAQHGEHHRAAHRRLHLHQRAGRIERASVCGCFRAGGGRIHPAGADSYRQRAGVHLRAELAGSHRHAAGEAIKRRKHGNTRRFAV